MDQKLPSTFYSGCCVFGRKFVFPHFLPLKLMILAQSLLDSIILTVKHYGHAIYCVKKIFLVNNNNNNNSDN